MSASGQVAMICCKIKSIYTIRADALLFLMQVDTCTSLGLEILRDKARKSNLQINKLICRFDLDGKFDYGKVTAVVYPQVIFTEYVLSVGYKT